MSLTDTFKKQPLLGALAAAAMVVALVAVARRLTSPSDGGEAEAATVVPVSVTPIVVKTMRGYVDTWGTVEPEPASDSAPRWRRPKRSARSSTSRHRSRAPW